MPQTATNPVQEKTFRCPAAGCHRAGPDLDQCPNKMSGGIMPCPKPVAVSAAKDVTIRCKACDRTWGVPVSDILKGKSMPGCVGSVDVCKAVVLK